MCIAPERNPCPSAAPAPLPAPISSTCQVGPPVLDVSCTRNRVLRGLLCLAFFAEHHVFEGPRARPVGTAVRSAPPCGRPQGVCPPAADGPWGGRCFLALANGVTLRARAAPLEDVAHTRVALTRGQCDGSLGSGRCWHSQSRGCPWEVATMPKGRPCSAPRGYSRVG